MQGIFANISLYSLYSPLDKQEKALNKMSTRANKSNKVREAEEEGAYFKGVLEPLVLAEFADDAIELVLLDGLSLLRPFSEDHQRAALRIYEAQKPPPKGVPSAAISLWLRKVGRRGCSACPGGQHEPQLTG